TAPEDDGEGTTGGVSKLCGHAGGVSCDFGDGIDGRSHDTVGGPDIPSDRLLSAQPVEVVSHRALALPVEVESIDDLSVGYVGENSEGELLQNGNLDYRVAFHNTARNGGFRF